MLTIVIVCVMHKWHFWSGVSVYIKQAQSEAACYKHMPSASISPWTYDLSTRGRFGLDGFEAKCGKDGKDCEVIP